MIQAKTQAKKIALITGAARRVGASIASRLHEAGFDVAIHCHQSKAEGEALAKKLNAARADSACVFVADLMEKQEALALIEAAYDWHGQLDCLINNASCFMKDLSSTPTSSGLTGGPSEEIRNTLFTTNVKAPLWLSEAAKLYLQAANNGNIVNITDIHAERPLKDYLIYSEAKAALKLQTETLALEYAPHIRINAVAPGAVALPEGDNALPDVIQKKMLTKIPLGQFGRPEYVAQAVLSLINNPYITGETIRVDGGRHL